MQMAQKVFFFILSAECELAEVFVQIFAHFFLFIYYYYLLKITLSFFFNFSSSCNLSSPNYPSLARKKMFRPPENFVLLNSVVVTILVLKAFIIEKVLALSPTRCH